MEFGDNDDALNFVREETKLNQQNNDTKLSEDMNSITDLDKANDSIIKVSSGNEKLTETVTDTSSTEPECLELVKKDNPFKEH